MIAGCGPSSKVRATTGSGPSRRDRFGPNSRLRGCTMPHVMAAWNSAQAAIAPAVTTGIPRRTAKSAAWTRIAMAASRFMTGGAPRAAAS